MSSRERYAVLAWLLELIKAAAEPEPALLDRDLAGDRVEAIEVTFRGKRFLVRVDEVGS